MAMAAFVKMVWCLIIVLIPVVAAMQNALKQGEFINSTTQLVSSNHLFAMGFFHIEESNRSYLGIWYRFDEKRVWVANRDTPIHKKSGVLSLESASGNLIIGHSDANNPIVLYSRRGLNRTLTLLGNGNLVLEEGNITIWQSFDHPTDTLLPGMKLGINHKTNRTWSLTSSLPGNDPASGAFTLEWDHRVRNLVIKFRGKPYWTSGKLINKDFENMYPVDGDTFNFNYKFINVTSEDEDYFSYTLMVARWTPESRKSFSGWNLDNQGNVLDGDRSGIVSVYNCYGSRADILKKGGDILKKGADILKKGCALWEQPMCRNQYQNFDLQTGYFVNKNVSHVTDNSTSLSYTDCKVKCWEDCNCLGFGLMNDNYYTGCALWKGSDSTFHTSADYGRVYVLRSRPAISSGKRMKVILIIIFAVLVSSTVVLLSGLSCYRRKKNKQAKKTEIQELLTLTGYTDAINDIGNGDRNELTFFSLTSILAATRNFSSDNKLGVGGFGPVYKGKFPDGQDIAVKRLSTKSTQGLTELKNELILIAKLQHTNLVRLLGCCIHRQEKMLIYEYMPNKSLDYFLFDESKRGLLTWERRFSIIEGISQGLLYLHKYSRLRIIHRDLKAANILLDQNMNPKISDFGLARIFKMDSSETNTSRVVGTYGYMAPEYVMEGIFSTKSDVFSFGVLILEILSGRKINSFNHVEGPSNLVAFAWELWNRDAAFELMDPSISDSCIQHQFLKCVHLGLLCVEDNALDRPTMVDFISMLGNDTAVLPLPKKPTFYIGSRARQNEPQEIKSSQDISASGLSISTMEAR